MKIKYITIVFLSVLLFSTNIFAQAASVTWALNNTNQLTSANVGNVTGSTESISAGSGRFGMSVFDYTSDGQRLWEGTAGWLAGNEEATRYTQFDAQPATGNSFTITNISFNYGAAGTSNNIQSNAYYSVDGWLTRTLLNPNPLTYQGSGMSSFAQTLSVRVASGSTFSVRIYPYSIVNSSPMAPTFAVHNNVIINGTIAAKKNCVIQVTNAAGKWGKQIFLTVKLQETSATGNKNLSNKMISFSREQDSVNGIGNTKNTFIGSGTTDANGVASIAYTIPQDSVLSSLKAPQDSVTHTIRAEFIGDANYNSQSSNGKLIVVRHNAGLAVAPTTSVFGQPVVFTATLMDNDNGGKGVSNQVLKFYKISPGTREGDTARVFIGSGKTNANGVASLSYTLPQDSIISSISVSFAGDVNYSPKNGTGKFTNTLKTSILQITNVAGKWGKSVLLTVRLQETGPAGNTNLPNRKISFSRESDTCDCPIAFIGSGTTDVNGLASIAYTIPQDSALSSLKAPQDSIAHTIKAEFAGDAFYIPQSSTGKLIVVRHAVNLTIGSLAGDPGSSISINATLTDNDNGGKGVSNQALKFYKISPGTREGDTARVFIGSGKTDANGVASISYTLPQDSVISSISVSYLGDANYSSKNRTGTFTKTLKNSTLQVTNAAGKWGKQIFLTVKLQETSAAGNTNLSNKMILFSREQDSVNGIGNAKYTFIGSGATNANGVASIAYTIPQDSVLSSLKAPQDSVVHTIRAEFNGDANYGAQSSTGKLIEVRHTTSISVASVSGVYGQSVTFVATLTDNDNDGKGISNQVLTFKISENQFPLPNDRTITNANGVASLVYKLPQDSVASTHVITAVYSGDANYSSQTGTGKLTNTLTGVEKNLVGVPTKYELSQNYPNPFNPTSTIRYDIPKAGFVNISMYDILGREVKKLVSEQKNPGHYEIIFDAKELASGIYFYTINSAGFTQSKKMILMK